MCRALTAALTGKSLEPNTMSFEVVCRVSAKIEDRIDRCDLGDRLGFVGRLERARQRRIFAQGLGTRREMRHAGLRVNTVEVRQARGGGPPLDPEQGRPDGLEQISSTRKPRHDPPMARSAK